jgi:hypothetical protein
VFTGPIGLFRPSKYFKETATFPFKEFKMARMSCSLQPAEEQELLLPELYPLLDPLVKPPLDPVVDPLFDDPYPLFDDPYPLFDDPYPLFDDPYPLFDDPYDG